MGRKESKKIINVLRENKCESKTNLNSLLSMNKSFLSLYSTVGTILGS